MEALVYMYIYVCIYAYFSAVPSALQVATTLGTPGTAHVAALCFCYWSLPHFAAFVDRAVGLFGTFLLRFMPVLILM